MMKLSTIFCLIILISCNSRKSGQVTVSKDSPDTRIDTPPPATPPIHPIVSKETEQVNQLLAEQSGGTLAVLTDESAAWKKEDFDYFIAPKRKDNPDYPYLTKGDFNGDGQADMAALVKTKGKAEYQLAILLGQPLSQDRIIYWKNDIEVCAISTYPKGELAGLDQPSFKLKSDAINVEYFERATLVIYWDGKAFRKTHTGD